MSTAEVLATLEAAGLIPVLLSGGSVYTYIDGPHLGAVEKEWLLTFNFESDVMTRFTIEQRLVGP